jgi:hypothetical protein
MNGGPNLAEESLPLVFLHQDRGEFWRRGGHPEIGNCVRVGDPAFLQAARAERLPAPAGARVVIFKKSWCVH